MTMRRPRGRSGPWGVPPERRPGAADRARQLPGEGRERGQGHDTGAPGAAQRAPAALVVQAVPGAAGRYARPGRGAPFAPGEARTKLPTLSAWHRHDRVAVA